MSKSKQTQQTQQTQQVTPTPDARLQQGVYNLQDMINNLGRADPSQFVAGSSPLQDQAFSAGNALASRMMGGSTANSKATMKRPVMEGGPQGPSGTGGAGGLASPDPNAMFRGAGALAASAGTAGANTVGNVAMSLPGLLGDASGYDASDPAGIERILASLGAASGPAGVERAATSGPAGVERGTASGQAGVERAQASLLGGPQGYSASTADVASAGTPNSVTLGGYDAATGQATRVGDLPTMQAARIEQDDINRLVNPYLSEVVDSTAADMQEQFGQVRARQAANAAGSGAFGGSRYGIREAQTEGEMARALGSTLGGLRADGYNTAMGYAGQDADRRQAANTANFNLQGQSALTDANAANQFGIANMDALNSASAFGANARNTGALANMDAENTFALTDADAANRANLTNAGLLSDAARFGADASNQFDQLNQSARNQFELANSDAANRSVLDFANRSDAMSMTNADAANRSALDFAGRSDAMGLANADAANRAALDYAGRTDAMGLANMAARNNASMANAEAANRSALDYAGRSDAAGQFNAGQDNQFGLAQFGADTDANFRNADAINNMGQFNAGQQDNALARMLQSAGLLGDLGATVGNEDRANIGLLAGLGDQQRGIDQDERNALPTLVQLIAQLQGSQPFGAMTGQTSNSRGTSTTTSSPSLMDSIGRGIGLGTQLIKF